MKRIAVTAAAICAIASVAQADTMAYWKFDGGTPGTQVPHSTAGGIFDGVIADSSGNGNTLSVWDTTGAGYGYRADVPTVGAPNTSSVQNTGGFPAMMSIDRNNTSGGNALGLNTASFSAFTVEASYKPETGGWRTLIGRDARNVAPVQDANLSALYLQLTPQNALAFKFADVSGVWHELQTADGFADPFDFSFGSDPAGLTGAWMNIAATSDGSMMKLYVNGALVVSKNIAGSSADTALTAGVDPNGTDDWTSGGWTVGRGLYNGGHGDRAWGFVDEVRISNVALDGSQLLFAVVPEPTTLTISAAAIGFLSRRRRA